MELKNSEAQLRRGLDQMTAFAEYVNEVWLACTPLMAAEYLHKHTASKTVRRWDPEVVCCGFFFAAGLARLLSVFVYGVPPPLVAALPISELVLPPVLVWWLSRVTDTSAR